MEEAWELGDGLDEAGFNLVLRGVELVFYTSFHFVMYFVSLLVLEVVFF